MAVSVRINGIDELKDKLSSLSKEMAKTVSTEAAIAGGETLIEYAKENVLMNFTPRSWNLYGSFKVVVTKAGYVRAGSYGLKYNRLQEYGGTIVPKNAVMLSWVGEDGVRRFANRVVIPARPYLRPAFDEHKGDIIQSMNTVIIDFLDKA